MPVITSVETRRGGVAAVTVDDSDEAVDLPLESLLEHNLHTGRLIEPPLWQRITEEGRHRIAVRSALEFLASRRRTRGELRSHLAKKFDEPAVERAVARIEELGYLDDAAWARDYVRQTRARGRGRSALARELQARGIDAEDGAAALAEHDDRDEALAAAQKRLRALRRLDPDTQQRRLYAFLRRRGFADDTVRAAIAETLEQQRRAELTSI
jgi:regulatory protein